MKRKRYDLSLATLGFEWAAAVGGLTGLGYWIDLKKGTDPWGVLIGLCLGFLGGTYNFVRAAQKAARENAARAAEAEKGEDP